METASERTLKVSVRDGVSHAFMLGCGETYLSAFAVFLHASFVQIGLLSCLPPLFNAFSQSTAVWIMEQVTSRKRLLTSIATVQALSWIPIAAVPFIFGRTEQAVWALMLAILVYHAMAGLITPIWNSLIGDLIPVERRGAYFGYRSKLCGLFTFVGIILAGFALQKLNGAQQSPGLACAGFVVIFLCAFLARMTSAYWLAQYPDTPYNFSVQHKFSFWDFIRRSKRSNFAKFVFFVSSINLAVSLASPFFAVYVLRELEISYLSYTAIAAASVISQFVTLERWGRISDHYGNKKILSFCLLGVVINPWLWLISSSPLVLFLVQFLGGAAWAGFNLAVANFLFDAVSAPKRARCVAYQSLVNAVFVCCGTLLGAYISSHLINPLPAMNWLGQPSSIFLFLFVLSGLIRLLAAAVFFPKFKEVRTVPPIRNRDILFTVAHIRPFSGLSYGLSNSSSQRRPEAQAADRKL